MWWYFEDSYITLKRLHWRMNMLAYQGNDNDTFKHEFPWMSGRTEYGIVSWQQSKGISTAAERPCKGTACPFQCFFSGSDAVGHHSCSLSSLICLSWVGQWCPWSRPYCGTGAGWARCLGSCWIIFALESSVDFFEAQSQRCFKGQVSRSPKQCLVATVSSGEVWPRLWIMGFTMKRRQGRQWGE